MFLPALRLLLLDEEVMGDARRSQKVLRVRRVRWHAACEPMRIASNWRSLRRFVINELKSMARG